MLWWRTWIKIDRIWAILLSLPSNDYEGQAAAMLVSLAQSRPCRHRWGTADAGHQEPEGKQASEVSVELSYDRFSKNMKCLWHLKMPESIRRMISKHEFTKWPSLFPLDCENFIGQLSNIKNRWLVSVSDGVPWWPPGNSPRAWLAWHCSENVQGPGTQKCFPEGSRPHCTEIHLHVVAWKPGGL